MGTEIEELRAAAARFAIERKELQAHVSQLCSDLTFWKKRCMALETDRAHLWATVERISQELRHLDEARLRKDDRL